MTFNDFIGWLREQGCEFIPMPDWQNANTLQVVNTKNGRAIFSIQDVFPLTIELVCKRLGVPLPPDYND